MPSASLTVNSDINKFQNDWGIILTQERIHRDSFKVMFLRKNVLIHHLPLLKETLLNNQQIIPL
jgi:hypothetical protein